MTNIMAVPASGNNVIVGGTGTGKTNLNQIFLNQMLSGFMHKESIDFNTGNCLLLTEIEDHTFDSYEDKPTYVKFNQSEADVYYWVKNGKLHRENNKPAVVSASGLENYLSYGFFHREDGPAAVLRKLFAGTDYGYPLTTNKKSDIPLGLVPLQQPWYFLYGKACEKDFADRVTKTSQQMDIAFHWAYLIESYELTISKEEIRILEQFPILMLESILNIELHEDVRNAFFAIAK